MSVLDTIRKKVNNTAVSLMFAGTALLGFQACKKTGNSSQNEMATPTQTTSSIAATSASSTKFDKTALNAIDLDLLKNDTLNVPITNSDSVYNSFKNLDILVLGENHSVDSNFSTASKIITNSQKNGAKALLVEWSTNSAGLFDSLQSVYGKIPDEEFVRKMAELNRTFKKEDNSKDWGAAVDDNSVKHPFYTLVKKALLAGVRVIPADYPRTNNLATGMQDYDTKAGREFITKQFPQLQGYLNYDLNSASEDVKMKERSLFHAAMLKYTKDLNPQGFVIGMFGETHVVQRKGALGEESASFSAVEDLEKYAPQLKVLAMEPVFLTSPRANFTENKLTPIAYTVQVSNKDLLLILTKNEDMRSKLISQQQADTGSKELLASKQTASIAR